MASNKKLDKDGLSKVWQKVFELIKSITGDVDVVNKGTLQDQINNQINKEEVDELEQALATLKVDVEELKTETSDLEFTQATTRANIVSGESMSTILGKIKKYFADLKTHAFNAPMNNLTTTSIGYALDANMGRLLKLAISKIGVVRGQIGSSMTEEEFLSLKTYGLITPLHKGCIVTLANSKTNCQKWIIDYVFDSGEINLISYGWVGYGGMGNSGVYAQTTAYSYLNSLISGFSTAVQNKLLTRTIHTQDGTVPSSVNAKIALTVGGTANGVNLVKYNNGYDSYVYGVWIRTKSNNNGYWNYIDSSGEYKYTAYDSYYGYLAEIQF